MSMEVFPLDLPGLDIEVHRQTVYATKVFLAVSGKETRATWWGTPRYRYALAFNVLRQDGYEVDVSDELATLQGFFDRHRGAFDSFLLDDPVEVTTPVRRRVRFANDELELTRVVDLLWDARKVELVSLK